MPNWISYQFSCDELSNKSLCSNRHFYPRWNVVRLARRCIHCVHLILAKSNATLSTSFGTSRNDDSLRNICRCRSDVWLHGSRLQIHQRPHTNIPMSRHTHTLLNHFLVNFYRLWLCALHTHTHTVPIKYLTRENSHEPNMKELIHTHTRAGRDTPTTILARTYTLSV